MRILIVGPPAAGKSTLAAALAHGQTDVQLHHVDQLRWSEPGVRRPREMVELDARRAAAGNSWVAEGSLGPTVNVFAQAADLIVFLDYPRRVTIARLLRRWATRDRIGMPAEHKEHASMAALRFAWSWQARMRPTLEADVSNFGTVLRISKPRPDPARNITRERGRLQLDRDVLLEEG